MRVVHAKVTEEDSRRVRRRGRWGVWHNLEVPGLYQKVPDATGLVDINLDQVARFPSAEFATTTRILAYEGFFDDEVWLRKNAQL